MLEAEISVDGDVYVEGHHVGQLGGFRFVPDQSAEGSDAKAVLAAAQKSLALEFEARAARLHASGNSDFAFGSDGVIRWLGEPVARLAADTSIMRPRAILLADDQLVDPARGFVGARIERFVNHHIATVLKPLDDLSRAEDIEGLAKGVAFQLVEELGVLFRRDVADEVKALDQDARGSMRRHGVRFGAYHIFMPALLKPAPAELITLLWALKNDGFDKPGYGDLIAMLAAGRTSIVADPSYERAFYKLAGFRYLGKRAVRIDILERLSDLIRPALHWMPGSGPRPDGAYDGRRFTSTPAMLSILGATPDDMEEILKGLGYRSDVVPPEEAAAHLARLDAEQAAKSADAEAAAPAAANGGVVATTPASGEVPAEVPAGSGASAEMAAEAASPATAATAAPAADNASLPAPDAGGAATAAEGHAAEADAGEERAAGTAAGEEKPEGQEKSEEEPRPVLLWRPLGRGDGRNRHQGRGRGNDRRDDVSRGGKPGFKGKGGKPGKPKHAGNDGPRHQQRPPRKDKPIDPDSPFAKLAALKEQMKK